ncbi:MAG: hypothetical protein ACI8UO_002399 [Verrucomicrobiales bacterium]|jgi:hypothetical protein
MATKTNSKPLPLVIPIGFAGSRNLFGSERSETTRADLERQLVEHLQQLLAGLHKTFGLSKHSHFFCASSQVAIGADFAFTQACGESKIPQRILLPLPSDQYLTSNGSAGPDFNDDQQ